MTEIPLVKVTARCGTCDAKYSTQYSKKVLARLKTESTMCPSCVAYNLQLDRERVEAFIQRLESVKSQLCLEPEEFINE